MFSSMYPNAMIAFNIERNTMLGKLIIEGFNDEMYDHLFIDDQITDISTKSNDDDDEDENENEIDSTYDAGKDFIDNYLTGDILSIGTKWFNLPSFDKLNEDFKSTFKIKPKKRFSISKIIEYFADGLNITVEDD